MPYNLTMPVPFTPYRFGISSGSFGAQNLKKLSRFLGATSLFGFLKTVTGEDNYGITGSDGLKLNVQFGGEITNYEDEFFGAIKKAQDAGNFPKINITEPLSPLPYTTNINPCKGLNLWIQYVLEYPQDTEILKNAAKEACDTQHADGLTNLSRAGIIAGGAASTGILTALMLWASRPDKLAIRKQLFLYIVGAVGVILYSVYVLRNQDLADYGNLYASVLPVGPIFAGPSFIRMLSSPAAEYISNRFFRKEGQLLDGVAKVGYGANAGRDEQYQGVLEEGVEGARAGEGEEAVDILQEGEVLALV